MTYIRSRVKTSSIMRNLLISLMPIIIFAFIKNGVIPYLEGNHGMFGLIYPLLFILVSTCGTFMIEAIYNFFKDRENWIKKTIDGYAFIPGLFLGLILPINTPISILLVGCAVSTLIGKMFYGGFGRNIFNPALVGRLFVISAYAVVISAHGGYLNSFEKVDLTTKATPLTNYKMLTEKPTYENMVAPYENGKFSYTYFFGGKPGTLGETSSFLCLIALVYLICTKTIKWRIPIYYIGTCLVMFLAIQISLNYDIWFTLFMMTSGGLLFGATFMATDPVTSPVTKIGQVIYGICLGLLTVFFRMLSPAPEGVLTSILTMNMFVIIINNYTIINKYKFSKIIRPFIFVAAMAALILYGVYYKKVLEPDSTLKIYDIKINGEEITYHAGERGYVGYINAEITIKNNKILKYEITDQSESFYKKIEDANYTKILLDGQSDLDKVDTVSGATISSSAIKKLLINVYEDYQKGGYKKFTGGTEPEKTSNFKLIEEEHLNNYDYYTVSNKGFSSTIKAKIIMHYNEIIDIEILSQDDSYFQKILDNDYINKLINEQSKIKETDVVTGATISSNALKELINETLIYHNNKLAKSDFYIKSKKMVGEIAVYEVVQKGFGGKIEMTITIGKNQIKAIQIGKNSESYLEPVKKDFISNLIQFNGEVDTVSGVTVSTTAIKNAVQKVVADNEVVR